MAMAGFRPVMAIQATMAMTIMAMAMVPAGTTIIIIRDAAIISMIAAATGIGGTIIIAAIGKGGVIMPATETASAAMATGTADAVTAAMRATPFAVLPIASGWRAKEAGAGVRARP